MNVADIRRKPQQERSRSRVEAILEVALELVVEQGSEALAMREVARRAGVQISSVYQYFPSKAAIIRELAKRNLERVRELLQDEVAALLAEHDGRPPVAVAVGRVVDAYFAHYRDQPDAVAVWAGAQGDHGLRELDLVELLRSLQQPVLGVCLGMQLLCAHSEEGDTECLGLIPAPVRRFAEAPGLRVPHMGWNRLSAKRAHPLLAGLGDDEQAYFVHSYAVPVNDWTLATSDYGAAFSAVIARDNYYGMQFHPERSAAVGSKLLRNFLEL